MTGAPPADPFTGSGHLLVVCALGVERLALRRGRAPGRSPHGEPPAVVLRTGMGPRAARAAMTRALRTEAGTGAGVGTEAGAGAVSGADAAADVTARAGRAGGVVNAPNGRPPGAAERSGHRRGTRPPARSDRAPTRPGAASCPRPGFGASERTARPSSVVPPAPGSADRVPTAPMAVVVTGFCAGLLPGMRPGDLVVAEETWDPDGRIRCTGFERLVAALTRAAGEPSRRAGHRGQRRPRVHTGPLVGTDHLVRGRERARLRGAGAVAADMESAVVLRTAHTYGVPQVAAVRVVVDAPGHELVRFRTLRGGVSAFRALSAVCPFLYEWHRP